MGSVNQSTMIEELAALVSQALERAGIRGTLSGGAAVSIYSKNEYESVDLDFITSVRNDAIAKALEPLGFHHDLGRKEFIHPDTEYVVEFPPGPLAFGETIIDDQEAAVIETAFGPLRVVTPTQSVMDRLAHYVAWKDNQAFDQAVMVIRQCQIDWDTLAAWAEREGAPDGMLERLRKKASRAD